MKYIKNFLRQSAFIDLTAQIIQQDNKHIFMYMLTKNAIINYMQLILTDHLMMAANIYYHPNIKMR